MKTLLRRTCRFTALLLVLLWGGAALPALAAPRTVTNTNDSGAGSLRFWINNAVPGDTIVFTNTLNGGTILLTSGELIVPQNLTIIGPGMTNLAVSGNHSNRVFEILTNITASISGLAIKNGSIVGTNGIIGVDLSASGGGVLNRGTLALTNCIISGNTVAGGTNIGSGGQAIAGGLLNYGALTLTGCLITGNSASGGSSSFAGAAQGGGMYNYGALTLTSCTLTGNRAGGGNGGWGGDAGSGAGGGILNNGVLMLTGCTLSSNSAAGGDSDNYGVGQGGGIANFGTILLTNCTLTANSASGGAGSEQGGAYGGSGAGGAIWNNSGGPGGTVVSCTISSNSCSGGPSVLETGGSAQGGGIDKGTVPFLIKNTIVSGNTATAGSGGYAAGTAFGPDISGTSVTSQGFNLIGITNDSSGWISSDLTGSKLTARDPQLGPLRDNGGPTPTMALLAGSAAIDYGHNSGAATDQRGLPRPINLPDYTDNPNGGDGCDIEAFEVQPSGPVATTLAASQVTSSGASLNGTVNPNGTTATAWFQWGISPSYGNSTPSTNAGAGSSAIPLGAAVTGLVPSTLYHFRAAATNSASTNYGNDLTFITTIIPPVVTTTPATSVTASSATLNGTVNPNGAATTNWFQWGTNTSYGNVIAAASTGSGNSAVPVTATLGSLVPGTTYHFRAVAYNGGGTNFGSDLNFTTLGASLVVTTLSDSGAGSLRAAIAQPGSGNIITFANGLTGTIPLPSGELLLDRAVTITGPGANVVSVSGNHSNRVFNIASGVTASISGLTIANGRKIGATGGNGVNCGDSGQAGGAGLGAGIYNLGNLTLSNCLVSGNAAWGGPGGSAFSILSYCNPSPGGNGGVAQGGGIFNGGSLGLVGCTFRTNQVTGGLGGTGSGSSASAGTGGVGGYGVGGAVYSTGAVQLVNSTFWGNTSTGGEGGSGGSDGTETSPGGGGNGGIGSGAAIELATGGVVAMTNCTLSGNTAVAGATGPGGVDGYFDVDSGDFIVLATGPNGSPGSALGGGLHAASALGGLLNTIIAGNTGGTSPDVNGAITSRGHNLIGATNNSSGWLASDVKGTVATPTNALLGPLQDNGGPTPTLALLTGSRAIDAGDDTATNSLASDQRGLLRFFGAHVDIGAYEVQVPRPTLTVRRAGSKVVLSWPSPSTGFLLLQSPGMNPPNWTTNNTTPSDNGTTRSVTNNSPTGVQFYRLKQ